MVSALSDNSSGLWAALLSRQNRRGLTRNRSPQVVSSTGPARQPLAIIRFGFDRTRSIFECTAHNLAARGSGPEGETERKESSREA